MPSKQCHRASIAVNAPDRPTRLDEAPHWQAKGRPSKVTEMLQSLTGADSFGYKRVDEQTAGTGGGAAPLGGEGSFKKGADCDTMAFQKGRVQQAIMDRLFPEATVSCEAGGEMLSVDMDGMGTMVTGDSLGNAHVWDARSGELRRTFTCAQTRGPSGGRVRCVRVKRVGRKTLLLTGGGGRKVQVWDAVIGGEPLVEMECSSEIYGIDMSMDGNVQHLCHPCITYPAECSPNDALLALRRCS
eukprot:7378787-Prymnesium_polylepis.1